MMMISERAQRPEIRYLTCRHLMCRRKSLLAAIPTSLTRRANQRHSDIIAKVSKPAPETAAGFFIC